MRREPTPLAKITRPNAGGILPRRRLFQLLDRVSHRRPILWVSGPAGSGKTSLVTSYLDIPKHSCLWYTLDEGDSDIATFFSYMGMAAKKASPRIRRPLPLLTPEYLPGISTFTLRFFENLYGRLKTPFFIVFDNYHLVALDSPLHEVIFNGISVIPEGVCVILISRSNPPAVFSQLRAQDQMGFLGWNELRFTLEESKKIVSLKVPKNRSKEMVLRIHQIADGWVAGLVLISDALKRGVEIHSLEKSSPEVIFDYFESELFTKMSKETQTFLMKTAFLPRMTIKMSEELTGATNGGAILSGLMKNNFFIEKHYSVEPVYQYHPLFRNFLLTRAKESFSREVLLDLHHRSALLLEESGQTEEAVELLAELKDWKELTNLVVKHAPMLMIQGRSQLLGKWIHHFPEELLDKMPWLLYWLGVCRLPYSPSETRVFLQRAFQRFEANEEVSGAFLAWAGIVNSILYEWNEYKMLDPLIKWLDKQMEYAPSFPSPEIEARVASSMTGAILWRQTYRPDIEEWLNLALRSSREIGDNNLFLQNNMWAITYFNWRADVGKLNLLFDEMKRMARNPSVSPLAAVIWRFSEATYCHMSNPLDSVRPILEAIDIARHSGIHVMDAMLLAHGVYGAFCTGNMQWAEEFLKEIEATLGKGKRDQAAHYHFLSGWFHFIRGEISQAAFHAERAMELAEESGYPVPVVLYRHLKAHVFHERGEHKQASIQLSIVKNLVLSSRCLLFEYVRLLTEAEFALDRGDEKGAVDYLSQAMTLGNKQEMRTMLFIWRPAVMARLCAKALDHGIEVDYVQSLIRTHHLLPVESSSDIESWPWPLKIYTLGQFLVLKDGKPIPYSRKAQEKPLSILKVLITMREKGIRADDIIDILWPDADGDSAYHSFQVTLHRFRALIGYSEAVLVREGRLSLDPKRCWVDAWAFEHLLGEADILWKEGDCPKSDLSH